MDLGGGGAGAVGGDGTSPLVGMEETLWTSSNFTGGTLLVVEVVLVVFIGGPGGSGGNKGGGGGGAGSSGTSGVYNTWWWRWWIFWWWLDKDLRWKVVPEVLV